MGRFNKLALALPVAALLALAACADDVPTHVPSHVAPSPTPAPVVEQPAPALVEAEPSESTQAQQQEAAVPERNRVLTMRLTEQLSIYHWPIEGLDPLVEHGPNTLLRADGWTESDGCEIWLRLDMNNDAIGWVRLSDTPLTESEARTLPLLEPPTLPVAELDLPGGERLTVTILGRSPDHMRYAVRLPNSEHALWAPQWTLRADDQSREVPVFAGPTFGDWRPISSRSMVLAGTTSHRPEMFSRPGGEYSGYDIRSDWHQVDLIAPQYPVMGRSLDGQWIALRLDELEPPVGWVQLEQLNLNVEAESLPYVLSGDTEVIQLDADGSVVGDVHRAPRLYHWQWRDDGVIVGSNDGLWRWNPALDEQPTQFAPAQWVVYSPDGRYAASGTSPDYESGDLTREITITEVDSGESITFLDAGAAYFTHHASDPSLHWSADSRHLATRFSPLGEDPWRGFYVLAVDGSRTEFDGERDGHFRSWLPDGTLLAQTEEHLRVYTPQGVLLRELPPAFLHHRLGSTHRTLTRPGSGEMPSVYDRQTGEQLPLPAPLDEPGWVVAEPYGRTQAAGRDHVLFLRANDGTVSFVVYDLAAHAATTYPDLNVTVSRPDYFYRSVTWSDSGDQVAFIIEEQGGFIVDLRSGTSRTIDLAPITAPYEWNGIVEWSPDGRWLLTVSLRAAGEYDDDGVSAYPARPHYARPAIPYIMEYRLIDAASGRVVQRFRANPDTCWDAAHTAAFSPDGQRIAFSGLFVDCT